MTERNRSIRVTRLRDQGAERDLEGTTPAERIGMTWQLTVDAWAFMGHGDPDAPMRRDVERVIHRGDARSISG